MKFNNLKDWLEYHIMLTKNADATKYYNSDNEVVCVCSAVDRVHIYERIEDVAEAVGINVQEDETKKFFFHLGMEVFQLKTAAETRKYKRRKK